MNVVENYEVNKSTMALIPVANMEYDTLVIEEYRQLFVKSPPIHLIKDACLEGDATYEGRRKAVMHNFGVKQKAPIPINPRENIFAFPTLSPTSFECIWIFYHHVHSITPKKSEDDPTIQSLIVFKNGHELPMNETVYIIEKQLYRTARCVLRFSPFLSIRNQNEGYTPNGFPQIR
jgi:competence protein ComK